MSCREHADRIYHQPQSFTEMLLMTGEGEDVFMSQVPEVKDFHTILAHLKLPPDVDADDANMPETFKVWAVSDPADVEGTRILILEKCLDDKTHWSGSMFLEVSETHIARYLSQAETGKFPNLYFSASGPDGVEYDIIVNLMDPKFRDPVHLLELNT